MLCMLQSSALSYVDDASMLVRLASEIRYKTATIRGLECKLALEVKWQQGGPPAPGGSPGSVSDTWNARLEHAEHS